MTDPIQQGQPGSDPLGSGTTTPGTGTYSDTAGHVESTTTGTGGETGGGREWLGQLQSMIDNVATQAAPMLREIGAKAAELAAVAGDKAGPFAHKAADATEAAGHRLAERGREVATDLRRSDASTGQGAAAGDPPNAVDPGSATTTSTWPDDTTRVVGE